MKGVSLVSGGVDSTLMALLLRQEGFEQIPVFIDYGQLAGNIEWKTCKASFASLKLPSPICVDLSGYGNTIKSGITDSSKDILKDAFLPGRNMMFIMTGAAISMNRGGSFVSIGLLSEEFSLFPDQKKQFLTSLEQTIAIALGYRISIITPLFDFSKADSIVLAQNMGINIDKAYSCHRGSTKPCGSCISCRERKEALKILKQKRR